MFLCVAASVSFARHNFLLPLQGGARKWPLPWASEMVPKCVLCARERTITNSARVRGMLFSNQIQPSCTITTTLRTWMAGVVYIKCIENYFMCLVSDVCGREWVFFVCLMLADAFCELKHFLACRCLKLLFLGQFFVVVAAANLSR